MPLVFDERNIGRGLGGGGHYKGMIPLESYQRIRYQSCVALLLGLKLKR